MALPSLPELSKTSRLSGTNLLGGDDLTSSDGLYNVAYKNGLQGDADRILRGNSGEQHKKFFSGGVFSDIFDTLNAASYGVVGTLKGKGFMDGIKNRESFSDKDALGQYGLVGVIGGLVLDIALDPLTYVAPWKTLNKIPGFSKAIKAAEEASVGKKVIKEIGDTGLKFEKREGGIDLLRRATEKMSWTFGKDPIYRRALEESYNNRGIQMKVMDDMLQGFTSFTPEVASKVFKWGDPNTLLGRSGDLIRTPLPELQRVLSTADFEQVKKADDMVRKLGQQLVDEGVLSKSAFEKNFDSYIKQVYEEYELAAGKGFKVGGFGVKTKARKEGIDVAFRAEKKQIQNPQYVYGATIAHMISNLENARLFNFVNKHFGSSKAGDGLVQVSNTRRFANKSGITGELQGHLGKINTEISPLLKSLKETFKLDKSVMSQIGKLEKQMNSLRTMGSDKFQEFFANLQKGTTLTPKAGKVPMSLKKEGTAVKKYLQDIQKQITNLSKKSQTAKLDKAKINKTFIELEERLSTLRFTKEDILDDLAIAKEGQLAGKFIPKEMHETIAELIDPKKYGMGEKIMAEFKYNKVVFSPAAMLRNGLSNGILNWWKLGLGPWNAQRYAQGLKSLRTKDVWYQRASKMGLGAKGAGFADEMKELLADKNTMSLWDKTGYTKVRDKMARIYQGEEDWAKLTAFKYLVEKKGLSDEKAWEGAVAATFNYSQVTPTVRRIRTAIWGVPFITFPLKAAPIALETIGKDPTRVSIFGKVKTAIENLSDTKETERERATEPGYIKNGFYVKLPMKDEHGRSAYFDLTYIIPFGDIITGKLFETPIKRETQMSAGPIAAGLEKSPLLNLIRELSNNSTFTGKRIWKDSDPIHESLQTMSLHIMKTFAPPWVSNQLGDGYDEAGNYTKTGFPRALSKDEEINMKRTFQQEMFSSMGLKVQPIDVDVQESINETNKKRALRRLLEDNNISAIKQIPYLK